MNLLGKGTLWPNTTSCEIPSNLTLFDLVLRDSGANIDDPSDIVASEPVSRLRQS